MTGSLVHHGKHRWSIVLELGTVTDPETGKRKRKQKWVTFHSTPTLTAAKQRKEAEAKLRSLLHDADNGTFVEPSKVTLLDYLRHWVEQSVKPPMLRPETYRVYRSMIDRHVAPSTIAHVPLQQLRGSHLERFYADSPLARSSVTVLHAVLHSALTKAVEDHLLKVNPAVNVKRRQTDTEQTGGPDTRTRRRRQRHQDNCWSATEARCVIDTAKAASPQMAAFVFLALDTGARKSELHGLTWADLDFDTSVLTIARQLDTAGVEPVWGPTKTKRRRTVTLGPETIERLRMHRQAQATLKMRNRTVYQDHGLIFAKEPEDLQTPKAQLGQPLKTLSEARFQTLIKQAGVKRVTFHGCRHTVATLSLQAGTPPHVVAARLGHSVVELMKTYAHALPDQQQDAAARLGALLHG